jgi:hypothetical protein
LQKLVGVVDAITRADKLFGESQELVSARGVWRGDELSDTRDAKSNVEADSDFREEGRAVGIVGETVDGVCIKSDDGFVIHAFFPILASAQGPGPRPDGIPSVDLLSQ